jgi:ribosomal protein S28E/S33
MSGATKPYVIQQGDYLDKLATQLGFDAKAVWNDGANADLRAKRKPDQLHPGDVLHIPDAPREGIALEHGTVNRYQARVPRVPLHLEFETDGKPNANEACVVEGLGEPLETKTGGDGRLSLAVPVTVRELSVRFVKRNVVYPVRVGDMDPIDEPSGVAKRLVHLGYLVDEPDEDPDAVADALRRFQRREGLPQTAQVDDATKAALLRAHKS